LRYRLPACQRKFGLLKPPSRFALIDFLSLGELFLLIIERQESSLIADGISSPPRQRGRHRCGSLLQGHRGTAVCRNRPRRAAHIRPGRNAIGDDAGIGDRGLIVLQDSSSALDYRGVSTVAPINRAIARQLTGWSPSAIAA
jgi:hypothetical protein